MPSRFAPVVLFMALTVLPLTSHGQTVSADETRPQQEKIGSVNIQEVIVSTRLGKKTFGDLVKQLVKQLETRQKELARQDAEINSLTQRLSGQAGKLSDKERAQLTATLESKVKAFHANEEQMREQREQAEKRVVAKLGPKVLQCLENYATTNGYAVILDTSGPTTGVLWVSKDTVSKLGLTGKPGPEFEKGLLAAFADKQASPIDHELIKACDAEMHSID
jgi:Skp family chaperone for outer membrane proteins